jgi:SAM-dependent methyltransferase
MAELLPAALERFEARPKSILDLACGEGTFAVMMSQAGYQVTGADRSNEMLRLARERATQENVEVEFLHLDMRNLPFEAEFDLVTCWFDSLNYLIEYEELVQTFQGVSRALKDGGLFAFDMNTIYGLAVNWQHHPAHIEQDTEDVFVIHRPDYDYERNIASMRITGFMRDQDGWFRMDEVHQERGYTLEEIRNALQASELRELACWGSIMEMTSPVPESGRVWFLAQKG